MYNFNDVYKYSQNLNVLYIEDDKNLLKRTAELLEDFFFKIDTATNGEEGLEKYKDFKNKTNTYYDLIITDINMPKMNGLDMIKEINKINIEQMIIVISAHNESDRLLSLIHEGIANFVIKPLVPKQFMTTLYKTCKIIVHQKEKNNYLIQQSKLASMGEMIDLIAHQWLQPIHIIKLQTSLMEFKNKANNLNTEKIQEYTEVLTSQVNHLASTIQEFRNFFQENNEISRTSYKNILDSVFILLKDKIKNTINIVVDIPEDIVINVNENQFKHIIINIINNSVDAFDKNEIKERNLIFNIDIIDDFISLNIIDNAGGIPKDIIDNIFDLKCNNNKSNVRNGLYLSKLIIEKMHGKLKAKNTKDGAMLSVLIKK